MKGLTVPPLVHVKGTIPYRPVSPVALKPSADESCTLCGICVDTCPAGALSMGADLVRDNARCISCAACVNVCPVQAQAFRGPEYEAYGKTFQEKFGKVRKEPELFL